MGELASMAEASLTEAMVEDMRSKIGIELRIGHSVFNDMATPLTIAKFADGIGDTNPLWLDPSYAAQGPFGGLAAPPSWVISCFSGVQFGWPGLGSFHCASQLRFLRPILVGDTISATCTYDGFDGPKPSRFAEHIVIDHFVNRYTNQRGELVADIRWDVINFERQTAKRNRAVRAEETTAEVLDIEQIEAQILAEEPRGRRPRTWEGVAVGDPLDEIIKGPVGQTDEVAFLAGGGAPIPRLAAHRAALRAYDRHPAWAFRDPDTGAWEPIYAVHYNRNAALGMGVPRSYDVGFQRQCWQIHLLTDWIGDEGWVKSAEAEYRSFVYLGDIVRLTGSVLSKFVDDEGEHVVEVVTEAWNQRGENVMPGRALLALPSEGGEISPARRRAN